jgi:hypothetical protein
MNLLQTMKTFLKMFGDVPLVSIGVSLESLLMISLVVLTPAQSTIRPPVQDYQRYFASCTSVTSPHLYITLRRFQHGGDILYLAVNPEDLSTLILRRDQVSIETGSWDSILERFRNTPYVRALREASENADVIQDAGITHFSSIEKGANLTVDLCPSPRPLDRELFVRIINLFGEEEKPVPVAISVTGLWMEAHERDLEWLKELQESREIAIVWVNHSYHHRTSRRLPLKENFLLEKGTDVQAEVLQTEIRMIEEGIIPSVFFRFPGLVSDKEIFEQILGFGLIPVGSDAWLGKNQWPKKGSIILLHGNGNEPIGIERFVELLEKEKSNIRNRQWLLYDLREGLEDFPDSLGIHKENW